MGHLIVQFWFSMTRPFKAAPDPISSRWEGQTLCFWVRAPCEGVSFVPSCNKEGNVTCFELLSLQCWNSILVRFEPSLFQEQQNVSALFNFKKTYSSFIQTVAAGLHVVVPFPSALFVLSNLDSHCHSLHITDVRKVSLLFSSTQPVMATPSSANR